MAIFNGFPATYQPMYYQQQYQAPQPQQASIPQQNNGPEICRCIRYAINENTGLYDKRHGANTGSCKSFNTRPELCNQGRPKGSVWSIRSTRNDDKQGGSKQ